MLQNHHHQGLIVEDQSLGSMNMGFFSNPNSINNLAQFHHHQFDSSQGDHHHQHQQHQQSLKYSFGDDDEDDDTHHHHHHHHHHHQHHQGASSNNSSSELCEALLISCANNPKPRDLHQDPSSFMGVVPNHLLSLHQSSSNPSNSWDWGSGVRESMVSKGLFEGDNESVEEDPYDNNTSNNNNNNMNNKKSNVLGISGLRMKKMKAGRRKVREPRFCFKTLSDVDVLDDGYKWRKYGQKVVKNTQHPRSYYRCTQDNCRVKKRVERLAEDPRMVITTYEGRHVHSPSQDNPDDESNNNQPLLNNFFW